MRKVFLSHTDDDASLEIARFLVAKLVDYGFEVTATDQRVAPGEPVREVLQDAIKECSVVVALVMKPSPKVFYELGYAQGIGKKTIILSDSETPLPSDLKAVTMVRFERSDSSFINRLLQMLDEASDFDADKLDYLLRESLVTGNPGQIFGIYRQHPGSFERIDNQTFERIVMRLFENRGLHVHAQPDGSLARYDFSVEGFEGKSRVVLEVKKYNSSSKISVGQVQQLLGAIAAERADLGILIAPTGFTRTAVDFVSRCHPRIELWDMEELEKRLDYGHQRQGTLTNVIEGTDKAGLSMRPQSIRPTRKSEMTCVSVDLCRYGKLSAIVDTVGGVEALFQFNRNVHNFFRETLREVGAKPDEVPMIDTGDGCLMFLSDASKAVSFAIALQSDAKDKRQELTSDRRRYCIGLSTGEIVLREERSRDGSLTNFVSAGSAIARAVRLQAQCNPDQVLISEETFQKLSEESRREWGKAVSIRGKAHEATSISARQWSPKKQGRS